jgi:hypothetical protein
MTETTRQPLVAALLRVQNRIQRIREQKESIGEQNTKAVLIDPVLSALGWSLEELQSPRLFVEAKGLPGSNREIMAHVALLLQCY